jgi:hypothetical protein
MLPKDRGINDLRTMPPFGLYEGRIAPAGTDSGFAWTRFFISVE